MMHSVVCVFALKRINAGHLRQAREALQRIGLRPIGTSWPAQGPVPEPLFASACGQYEVSAHAAGLAPGGEEEFLRDCVTLKVLEALAKIGLCPQLLVFVAGDHAAWSSLDSMQEPAAFRVSSFAAQLPSRLAG
jgi:hypothetical protein